MFVAAGSTRATLSERLARGEVIDIRGDGKAGGGLVLAMQALGVAIAADRSLDVCDWPLFSSARKGANVRAFLRVAKSSVSASHQARHPDVALLMNEAAAEEVDFAEGTDGALYVISTRSSPEEAARRYRLGGVVVTIAADDLGNRHLGRPLGNVAVFAALVQATAMVEPAVGRAALAGLFKKRRLPEAMIAANLAIFDEALGTARAAEFPATSHTDHRATVFAGYGPVPVAAQAALRSSRKNRTSGYGRPGVRVEFADAAQKCNGCSLCVVQCPEGIIEFTPDRARGAIVHGARFDDFCKACRECIAACPLDLFHEVESVEKPGVIHGA